jgi:hypothetical protein
MGAFEYRQAEEIRDAFARHGVRYLFLGKSGAILLGFPDTTQDADALSGATLKTISMQSWHCANWASPSPTSRRPKSSAARISCN